MMPNWTKLSAIAACAVALTVLTTYFQNGCETRFTRNHEIDSAFKWSRMALDSAQRHAWKLHRVSQLAKQDSARIDKLEHKH